MLNGNIVIAITFYMHAKEKGDFMDFNDQVEQFSNRINNIKNNISTEEATKTSLILPFFQLMGYDVFNPYEFVPEYTADTGIKKGEKVDYAIIINNEPLILIEAKSANTELSMKHMNQLLRYFTVTKARFAILTNGIVYRFYSDLEETNKMDTIPFLEIDLLNLKKESIRELKRFCKDTFDKRGILDSASELKYVTMVKKAISEQFQEPSDQLIKALITKSIYSGAKTQAVLDKFRGIVKKSFTEYINDIMNERFKNAISQDVYTESENEKENSEIEFSSDELKVLDYVRNLIKTDREIIYKKTSGYAYMQVGNSSRRWICRVYIRQSNNLFVLHKFDQTAYECEYYFDSVELLELIGELIQDVFEKCCNI